MEEVAIKLIVRTLKFIYVVYGIRFINERKELYTKAAYMLVPYLVGYGFFMDSDPREYILKHLFEILVCVIALKLDKQEKAVCRICKMLVLYEGINVAGNISGSVLLWLFASEGNKEAILLTVTFVMKCLLVILGLFLLRSQKVKFHIRDGIGWCFFYFLIVCIRIPFLFTDISDGKYIKTMVLSIGSSSLLFLWLHSRHLGKARKEKEMIEKSNKVLSARLHKSQELLPAVAHALQRITEDGEKELKKRNEQLLSEVKNLYKYQIQENRDEDFYLKNFQSTGLIILDQQIMTYRKEAHTKGITIDVFVQDSIQGILKVRGINPYLLHRALGDLMRNAITAVENSGRGTGDILLIIGCRNEGVLEIEVMDSGAPFPLMVLEHFGTRGVSTKGSGNGLADLLEFTKSCKASVCMEEYEEEDNIFTKKITIIFDGYNNYCLKSSRRQYLSSSFWSEG